MVTEERPVETEPLRSESAEERHAREWLENVYQGDHTPQLTPRAVVTGMLIGGVMSISNLYVGLKTGWGLGVTITACIIAYAVYNVLERIVPAYRTRPFSILENYTMSSAASAAGYMSSAGLVSAIPALYLTTGRVLGWWELMTWLGAVSFLGVFMAIPLKRQLINVDQLPFPSGTATAETLKSMHSEGAEAIFKARSLFWAAVIGAAVAAWKGLGDMATIIGNIGGWKNLSERVRHFVLPETFPLYPTRGFVARFWPARSPILEWLPDSQALLSRLTVGFEGSVIMVAAGAIMGIRVGVSLLVGAIVYFGIIGNVLLEKGIIQKGGYREIVSWTLWPATAMMVTSGLLSFAFRWRTIVRAFGGLLALFGGRKELDDPLAHVEVPGSWFAVGTFLSGAACVALGVYFFAIHWWMGVAAVLVTFLLSIVAARATGETDVTPIGAMGKITQLLYGALAPSNITTNLMTASITAGAASHSADLLTDLKSGYLLGGNPRQQTISQLFGVLAGTLICVPVYMVVAQPEKLGSEAMPAPAAQVWAGVARMLANGLKALPPGAVSAMVIGGIVGIVLAFAEEFLPDNARKWVPSATGLGIAGVIPAFNSVSMFLGALVAWIFSKWRPAAHERYTIAVSSGLIAGESLMGVAIILALEAPGMIETIWKSVAP